MKTLLCRKLALFFLLGATVMSLSPRSVFANDSLWNGKGDDQQQECRSNQDCPRNQDGKNGPKPCRNMHPELQIAEPFNRSHDSDQGE